MRRIPLGNHEFEGQNNAYLLRGGDMVTLVDTGVSTRAVRDDLSGGLEEAELGFEDVDRVVLTHWHPDHAGLAGAIQDAGGAEVLVHPADAPLVRGDPEALASLRDRQVRRFGEWGMPAAKREAVLERLDAATGLIDPPAAVEPIEDGDRIDAGESELRVLHAPGHTAGLCCFEFDAEEGREAYVGDAVLPVYTPNIGGADVRVDRPLETYLATLRRIAGREYGRIWPGHREVIESPTARARTIVEHHRERAERVVGVLREHGPADAWTVSAHLFGDLEGIHTLHGPGEAFAHLDHLAHAGVVAETPDGYRLEEPEPALEDVV